MRSPRSKVAARSPPSTLAPKAGVPRGQRVEHTYERNGALTYLAAWDVRRGGVVGRREPKGGIEAFGCLVEQVMTREPYASATRVLWIVDNGSSHRGKRSVQRLQGQWPTLRLVHTPIHASWLKQIEIYFSIVQRKVLTPNDFDDLDQVEQRLADFEQLYNQPPNRSPRTSPARNSTPGSSASTSTDSHSRLDPDRTSDE
jgi:hypothetical protein